MEEELRPSKSLPSLLLAEQTMQRLLADGAAFSTPASRRRVNYQPSLWDDNYIQSLPDASLDATQVNLWEKLNEEVKHLIDHNKQKDTIELLEEDFLVRSFKNENGSFKVHIVNDVKGMLSLYEASYLSVEGEDDQDEAMEFTTKHLTLLALINTTNDIPCAFSKEKGLDILPQLKRAWGDQCKAYLVEAIWYNTRYTPTLKEYMENAWLSIAIPLVLTVAYLLSEDLTKEALNSLEFYFDVSRYSSMVTRLYDDLETSTDELQRGDVPKSIQCYMNETNVSEFVAWDHIRQLIKNIGNY